MKNTKFFLNELKQYNPELEDKQRILAITKCDTIDEELIEELEKDLKKRMKGKFKIPYLFISAQSDIIFKIKRYVVGATELILFLILLGISKSSLF